MEGCHYSANQVFCGRAGAVQKGVRKWDLSSVRLEGKGTALLFGLVKGLKVL